MQKFNGSLIRQFPSLVTGNAAAGVQVSVFIAGGNTLATLYETNNTAGAQLPNPLTTDSKGFYSFYAADGQYRLGFSNGYPALEIQLLDAVQSAFFGLINTGWFPAAGSFEDGGTITERNQYLQLITTVGADVAGGYSWGGALPKTVTAGSAPATSGGTGANAWVYRSDTTLRSALANPDSTVQVGGVGAGKIAKRAGFFEIDADLGGVGDGVADNSAALGAAVDKFAVINGVYRVSTNTTILADVFFLGGAKISVDAGVTLTILGNIVSPDSHIFTGDGSFAIHPQCKMPEIKAAWFGIIFDDQSGTIPDDNCKAIRKAAAMAGSLGIPNGLYRNRVCRLPIGLMYLDDDDSDGVYINLPSYVALWGYGDNSVLRPKDNAKAGDVVAVTQDGANSWSIDYLEIYGEWSLQNNTQNAIAVRPPSSPALYSEIGRNIYIKEMSGRGISVTAGGMNDSSILAKLVRDSKGHNLYVSKCANLNVLNGKYRTAKAGSYGAVFDGVACVSARIIGNEFNENNAGGLLLSNVGGRFEVKGNRAQQNGYGFFFDRVNQSQISGNFAEQNNLSGYLTDGCNNNQISGNFARSNGQFGFLIASSSDNQITDNHALFNGSAVDNTYDGFNIQSNSDRNFISNNFARMGSGVNRQRYGLNIEDVASDNNVVLDNDLRLSGVTGGFNNNSTTTDTTNGNKT